MHVHWVCGHRGFLSVFPFFPKDFRGSASVRNPCFFGGFPCRFQKGKEKKIRDVLAILRRSARAPTINALRATVAIKGIFDKLKGLSISVTGVRSPYTGQDFHFLLQDPRTLEPI